MQSDIYIFETNAADDNENIEELKSEITSLKQQISEFQENAKKNAEVKELKSQIKSLNLELSKFKNNEITKEELAKELNEIKTNIKTKEFNEFIDNQITAGTLTPANKDAVFSVLWDLDNLKKFDESPNSVELFKSFIVSLPKQIEFNEIAKKKPIVKVDAEKYADADEESLEIYKEAAALAEQEKISFRDALLKIKN